jgi:2-(1,2-epoxy-1,2-dihydrophenyl)acetyl-CoA isomerase
MTASEPTGPPTLDFTVADGVARIRLQRPDAANAINMDLASRFRDAVAHLVDDPDCRVVVVEGSAKFFCAGGDVAEMLAQPDPEQYLRDLTSIFHDAMLRLSQSRLLTIVAVEGTAAGAGFALVLNADIVIASASARFVSAYTQVGLTPDTGFSALVTSVVGSHRAKELVLLNRVLDAATALYWGIVAEIVEGPLEERVTRVAAQLAAAAQPASAEAKRLLNTAASSNYRDRLADESDTIARMVRTSDAQARLRSFAERDKNKEKTS